MAEQAGGAARASGPTPRRGDAFGGARIEPVADKRGLLEFVKFPFSLYRGDPNWVPPFIRERLDFFDPAKNPFFEHARHQLFLAYRNGELAGTVGAVVDDHYNRLHGERMGAFGFFECVDDPSVAASLLRAAEDWGRRQGVRFLRGPLNFSTNQECGLLVEGFETPPMVMMTHNPRYYPALIEGCGYRKVMDLYAYIGEFDECWRHAPAKVFRAAQQAARRDGIRVRPLNKRRYDEESKRIKEVYDSAWRRHWGFAPLTEGEFAWLAARLKPFIDPEFVLIAETRDGTPVGVSLALPDLNQALKGCGGGRLSPLTLLRFLWHRRQVDQLRLIILGVIEEYRHRGIDAAFWVQTARAAIQRGYRRMEGSWVLETNTVMNRIGPRLGYMLYKTYRIYERPLPG